MAGKKAFGGLKDVLQVMSNHGPIEQPELVPMPNGYGTVRLPHLAGQPGSVRLLAAAEVVTATGENERWDRYSTSVSRSILVIGFDRIEVVKDIFYTAFILFKNLNFQLTLD